MAASDLLQERRAIGQGAGARTLEGRGFVYVPARGGWEGEIVQPWDGRRAVLSITLPACFPDCLPEIYFRDWGRLNRRLAHVEDKGKICFAARSGVLLNSALPERLVSESIDRAMAVLVRGQRGLSDPDLAAEFQAYWPATDGRVYSICAADKGTREIGLYAVASGATPHGKLLILANSSQDAEHWSKNLGATCEARRPGYFVRLLTGFRPPLRPPTLADLLQIVLRCARAADNLGLRQFLLDQKDTCMIVLALPESEPGMGTSLVSFGLDPLSQEARSLTDRGFRRGRPLSDQLSRSFARQPPLILRVVRMDSPALTARGGAPSMLRRLW